MSNLTETTLKIDGMHCAGCVYNIEQTLSHMSGVKDCRVNLVTGSAVVSYETGAATEDGIIQRIAGLGYKARTGTPDILDTNRREEAGARLRFIQSLTVTIPLMVVAMWPMIWGGYIINSLVDGLFQLAAVGAVIVVPGRGIFIDALRQTRHLRANMNSLIAMGTLAAYLWSLYLLAAAQRTGQLYFDSAAMIITLILLGRFLESRAKGRAGQAIRALMDLRPIKALAVINGIETEIDAATVKPGMNLIVRPGERIPADGVITRGSPYVDESMLTGESVAVEKTEGDAVIGGSLNGSVAFELEVTASGEKSYLASVIRMVTEAQSKKAPVQKLADRVASVFVPIVLLIALVTFGLWYYLAPGSPMMVKSVVSVLIIACPCALGLATPTAILVGSGRAARDGIIVRGGDVLETLSRVNTVIFDKTGTLTYGKLSVLGVKTFGEVSERTLLRMVGSAELQAEHPLAKAIVSHVRWQQIELGRAKNVKAFPGFGVRAEIDGKGIIIGNRRLMAEENVNLGAAQKAGDDEMEKGRTVVFVALEGRVIGLISLADKLRLDADLVVKALKARGKKVHLLSGDTYRTAKGVARAIKVDDFHAEVRPEQKKVVVESIRKAGNVVAMVGDGINDAPALAAASVGVAVGTGTDVAIETAGVVLAKSELSKVTEMFDIAGGTMRVIKQNLFWAFFYNVLAIPIAAGLLYPVMGLTLSPMIAAAAMAMSSLFVVTNSLRLNRSGFGERIGNSSV